jgi:hypothetical protein
MGLSFRREFRRRQEDDEALAKFVRQGLEAENYSVDVLADGEQARTAATDVAYPIFALSDQSLLRISRGQNSISGGAQDFRGYISHEGFIFHEPDYLSASRQFLIKTAVPWDGFFHRIRGRREGSHFLGNLGLTA